MLVNCFGNNDNKGYVEKISRYNNIYDIVILYIYILYTYYIILRTCIDIL